MKKTIKKTTLKKSKTTVKSKKKKPVKKAKASLNLADSKYIYPDSDPAHAPGHKKMNLRNQFKKTGHKNDPQNSQARNSMTAAAKIKRTSATNRRIITGAAIGKTGQMNPK